ncbi:MAG: ATP-binding protein [Rhizomicrobium sp.]
MAQAGALAGSFETGSLLRRLRAIGGRARAIVPMCMVLISASFVCAGTLQMWLGRAHALSQAEEFGGLRARQAANGLGQTLDRYVAIADAFEAARTSAETSAALSLAGGATLRDVAVLDRNGRLRSEMTGAMNHLLPLPLTVLAQARKHRTLAALPDGQTLALLFPRANAILSAQVDIGRLLAADGVLATSSGQLLALGNRWRRIPPADALALAGANSLSRIVEDGQGSRLVSLARVSDWPLVVGTSVPIAKVPNLWSGSLPLYLFMVLVPALVGATLTALFAPIFIGHARTAARSKSLRATRTAETRLLVRLARAERRASEAEGATSRFISHVSHELRTPLNAIIGFAEALESNVFGVPCHPKYCEYARDIGVAGRELHTKIGAVLEYAALGKPAEPETATDPTSDAATVARSQVHARLAVARERGVRLEMVLPNEAPVRIDAESLGRILAHLLDNAIAYTPKGGSVRVEVRADTREVVVTIRDSGTGFTGIEREQAGRPFQRFTRPGSSGGMGVGLAIAMGLARRFGATLSLASSPGEGTRAELRVPRIA